MGRRRKTPEHATPDEGGEVLSVIDEQLKVAGAMRDYSTEFADANPDNPHAQEFRLAMRRAKSALADARLALRSALGATARDAREGAERELATHHGAMRPKVN